MSKEQKLRTFEIKFAFPPMEKVNEMMRKFDVGWGPEEGACQKGRITSHTTLPLTEYHKLMATAFKEMGGKLYDIYEVIRSEQP